MQNIVSRRKSIFLLALGCFVILGSLLWLSKQADKGSGVSTTDMSTYKLVDETAGDINADGRPDKVVVFEKGLPNPDMQPDRLVVLTIQQKDGTYKVVAENAYVAYCKECGGAMGDPYVGVKIESNTSFSVSNFGGSAWRWSSEYTFTYDGQDWFLSKIEEGTFHTSDPETTASTSVATPKDFGVVTFSNFIPE